MDFHHTEPLTYQTWSFVAPGILCAHGNISLMDQICCHMLPYVAICCQIPSKYQYVNGLVRLFFKNPCAWPDWICQRKLWVQYNSLVPSDVLHDVWSQALCVWYCWFIYIYIRMYIYIYIYSYTHFYIYVYVCIQDYSNLLVLIPPFFMQLFFCLNPHYLHHIE